jgi:hypothetical protein
VRQPLRGVGRVQLRGNIRQKWPWIYTHGNLSMASINKTHQITWINDEEKQWHSYWCYSAQNYLSAITDWGIPFISHTTKKTRNGKPWL